MLNAKIRVYKATDYHAVVRLWNEVFPGGAERHKPENIIARKLEQQPELFFVAVSDETVIGTVLAGYDGVRGWVHRVAVHPDFRRKGLASKLMQRAEQGLKDAGCPKLNLQVRNSNIEVLEFYESLGFNVEDITSFGKVL